MIWMILAMFAMGAFANMLRYGHKLKVNLAWTGVFCYVTAGTACACAWALQRGTALGWQEAVFGSGSGLTILAGYFLFSACIRMAGVGVAQVFERLSMLVAAGISILLWKNVPGPLLGVGLLLAAIAIPLISKGPAVVQISSSRARVSMLLLLLVITGIGSACLEEYRRGTSAHSLLAFLVCQYAAINLGILAAALWKRAGPRGKDIALGVALGLLNVLFYYASLKSLGPDRPGTVVFPTIAAGTILVSAGLAALLWGERYRRRTLLGMALAVAALILINIKLS